jgi:hypothetical protein
VRHICMFSGGMSSAYTAKRVVDEVGKDTVTLLFTDTLWEDEDTYRFLYETAAHIGAPLVVLKDGRTPEELFFEQHILGNNRVPVCSRVLKADMTTKFVQPGDILYFGIAWHESHRAERIQARYAEQGIECRFSLCEPPYVTETQMRDEIEGRWQIRIPRMYPLGFAHANCGGRCVRAGKGHYAHLFRTWPERYKTQEDMEERFRQRFGWDVSILKDSDGKPLTLKRLRETVLEPAGRQCPLFAPEDYAAGPCVCFDTEVA